jgi:hypothetical protein
LSRQQSGIFQCEVVVSSGTRHLPALTSRWVLISCLGHPIPDGFECISNHLLVGGLDKEDGETKGRCASDNRGGSWRHLLPHLGEDRFFCHDARFHPAQSGLVRRSFHP